MLRYANQVASQQPVLAPLQNIVSTVPACELYITFANQVNSNMGQLSTGALKNISKISRNMAKVFDYLYTNQTQSVLSSQYLMNLANSARSIATQTALAAIVSSGTTEITITQGAQSALSTLDAWDPVQGYQTPNNPGNLATIVMNGVTIH